MGRAVVLAAVPVAQVAAVVAAAPEDGEGVARVRGVAGRDRRGGVAGGRDGYGRGRVLHRARVTRRVTGRRGRVVAAAGVWSMVRWRPHRLPEQWRFVPRVVKVVVQLALVVPAADKHYDFEKMIILYE